jgi:hypothetical protein
MSIIVDAMQPLIPSGILNAAGKLEKLPASDAIILGKAGYSVVVNPDGSFVLDFRDEKPLIYALCCDCSRFASAAFQSLGAFSSETCDKFSFPWDLIKLYYSAFYAAHCIIRLAGQSCSYLSHDHTKRLNEYLSATVNPAVVAVGALSRPTDKQCDANPSFQSWCSRRRFSRRFLESIRRLYKGTKQREPHRSACRR